MRWKQTIQELLGNTVLHFSALTDRYKIMIRRVPERDPAMASARRVSTGTAQAATLFDLHSVVAQARLFGAGIAAASRFPYRAHFRQSPGDYLVNDVLAPTQNRATSATWVLVIVATAQISTVVDS